MHQTCWQGERDSLEPLTVDEAVQLYEELRDEGAIEARRLFSVAPMAKKYFYLVKRKDRLTDGKPTWYCRFRALDGTLLAWRSTGFTAKTAAESWAI